MSTSSDWRVGSKYNLKGKQYLGVDASKVIIDEIQEFMTPSIKFICVDAAEFLMPHVDLVLIKDVLQHLDTKTIKNILEKVFTRAKFALFCNDILPSTNSEIEIGGYRGLNLQHEPFNLKLVNLDFYGTQTKPINYWEKESKDSN